MPTKPPTSSKSGQQLSDILMGPGDPNAAGQALIGEGYARTTGLQQAGTTEAFRLADEEEARGQRGEDMMTSEFQRAHNTPTMSDEHMRMMMGQGYDEAAGQYQGRQASLMDALGFTGGGQALGMMRDSEMMRLGQMDTVRTNAVLEKAKSDAFDRMNRWQATGPLYSALTRDVAMQKMDWLTQVLGVKMSQQGFNTQLQLGKQAADAAKQGGIMGAIGGIGGGLIGAFAPGL